MTSVEFWNKYLRTYDALNTHKPYREYLESLGRRSCISLPHGCRILDAGSGTGNLSIILKRLGAQVISLDFSDVALSIHREKEQDALQIKASLEETLPLANNTFDTVVCTSVLFALSRNGCKSALREFRRVLVPGGRLIATVMRQGQSKLQFAWEHVRDQITQPFATAIFRLVHTLWPLVLIFYYNLIMQRFKAVDKYRRFSLDEFVDEIREAGYNITSCESVFAGRFYLVEAAALK